MQAKRYVDAEQIELFNKFTRNRRKIISILKDRVVERFTGKLYGHTLFIINFIESNTVYLVDTHEMTHFSEGQLSKHFYPIYIKERNA